MKIENFERAKTLYPIIQTLKHRIDSLSELIKQGGSSYSKVYWNHGNHDESWSGDQFDEAPFSVIEFLRLRLRELNEMLEEYLTEFEQL